MASNLRLPNDKNFFLWLYAAEGCCDGSAPIAHPRTAKARGRAKEASMGDDIRAQAMMGGDPALARNLQLIADALGVPVSDFYGSPILDQEAQTLLTLVQAYFSRVDPDARERFVRALLAIDAR